MTQLPFDRKARLAFIIACITLLGSGLGFRSAVYALNLYLKKEPVELRQPLTLIAPTLGRWKSVGTDRVLDAAMIQELGTDKYLDRTYVHEGYRAFMNVHVAYYTGMIDTVPHVPDRCFAAAGLQTVRGPNNLALPLNRATWEPDPEGRINQALEERYEVVEYRDSLGQRVRVRMPVGDIKLRTVEFQRENDANTRVFGGYFFIANGRASASPEGVKLLAFNTREKFAYYCKVQLTFQGTRDTSEEQYLEMSADLLKDLLPELMRCLPDWSEIEAATAAAAQRSSS